MDNKTRAKRVVVLGAIAAGSILAAVPSLTSATSATSAGSNVAATSTTVAGATTTTTAKPKTTTIKTTTTSSAVAKNYEVVAGIYSTQAKAQAHIDALTKAKFKNFTIKKVSSKFAVVKASLTKSQAKTLAKQINANKGLGTARIKKLA